jgi:hypothetical protein
MKNANGKNVRGTAEYLTSHFLLNGQNVPKPYLSVLSGFGIAVKDTGEREPNKVGKGKPLTVYELVSRPGSMWSEKVAEVKATKATAKKGKSASVEQ